MWRARTWLRVRRPVCRDADARVDLAQQPLARLERGLLARQLVLHALLRVVPVELRELEQQRARRLLVQVGALAQDVKARLVRDRDRVRDRVRDRDRIRVRDRVKVRVRVR